MVFRHTCVKGNKQIVSSHAPLPFEGYMALEPDTQGVKDLYKERSAFVHGSFFIQIRKEMEIKDGLAKLPSPPFHFLYCQKERIRIARVAYIHLNKIRKGGAAEFTGCASVLDILEHAVIDLETRAAVRAYTELVLRLM